MARKFAPPRAPSVKSTRETEFRVLESPFGDGYTQRAGAGLNAEGVSLTAIWSCLSIAQADRIEDFFRALRGVDAFAWQAPRDRAPMLYRCKGWKRSFDDSGHDTIRATIERVHDL